ncbi:MAG: ribulose-phosphate 3-epimerase [Epulopiscium sp.]|jgi:ribulose-phosphate 3-epimerase|uniref:Ribulose-phosphate 3-epimerase n=1 Tax=Defluviitalea raffinosedens TaxID=1450156 RepID=A0A7C8LGY8_9FIRM|nr:ribulose-phosphate 3-epimerase [Defluviitalea raffinosedens]MBZ4668505.1 rpe [Defluviitaleaceae bacterium]MDK2789103.1 ribulose-phosphate 3-epimerase [Candidatus Epulonipiscium sp.]KAE9637199.1 ribulose-phosphate 3-epimerase [Defluviitalea raffinosedens]MBM7685497.1 ribulose-phosphate 3-epimerase [Defluviitalea raffinosedens]HHW66774.1 ribulose-phosphate 3-epimerase [Candidatus Epulonipiscium sp.]
MIKLAPSILSADFSQLKDAVQILDKGGAHLVHIDVMDGHFVPNITLGPPVIKSLRKHTKLPFDVHLMISNPDQYLESFHEAGADILTVHAEACTHLHRTVQQIKKLGMKAGVALNPATDLSVLKYILPDIDMVLIMTVNPGFGGQTFIPQCLDKIRELSKYIQENQLPVEIEIDGGANLDNAEEIIKAGTNILVAGSAVYDTPNPVETIQEFIKVFSKFGE